MRSRVRAPTRFLPRRIHLLLSQHSRTGACSRPLRLHSNLQNVLGPVHTRANNTCLDSELDPRGIGGVCTDTKKTQEKHDCNKRNLSTTSLSFSTSGYLKVLALTNQPPLFQERRASQAVPPAVTNPSQRPVKATNKGKPSSPSSSQPIQANNPRSGRRNTQASFSQIISSNQVHQRNHSTHPLGAQGSSAQTRSAKETTQHTR
jgi:hypothetical protein